MAPTPVSASPATTKTVPAAVGQQVDGPVERPAVDGAERAVDVVDLGPQRAAHDVGARARLRMRSAAGRSCWPMADCTAACRPLKPG